MSILISPDFKDDGSKWSRGDTDLALRDYAPIRLIMSALALQLELCSHCSPEQIRNAVLAMFAVDPRLTLTAELLCWQCAAFRDRDGLKPITMVAGSWLRRQGQNPDPSDKFRLLRFLQIEARQRSTAAAFVRSLNSQDKE